jgi:hypothetical protein
VAEQEAAIALAMLQDVDSSPAADALAPMRAALVGYCRHVAEVEFPRLQDGAPPQAQRADPVGALWRAAHDAGTAGASQQAVERLKDNIEDLTEARTRRLLAATDELPSVIWLALAVGGILTIGFACAFGAETAWVQALMIGALAALLAVLFYVVIELDHPFTGTVAIEATGFERVLEEAERR